jgi:hypothetical protein
MSEPEATSLDAAVLAGLRDDEEIEIETSGPGRGPRRVIIWSVVVDGVPYIRSFKGASALWYRDVVATPTCVIHVGSRRASVRAIPEHDEVRIAAVSEALLAKYPSDPATAQMVSEEVLATTLRLEAAES